MALNIKNERVSQLAQQLAELTGNSITDAVGEALEARIAELQRQSGGQSVAEQLMAIGRKCANQAPADWRARDFDEELYDERGLPR